MTTTTPTTYSVDKNTQKTTTTLSHSLTTIPRTASNDVTKVSNKVITTTDTTPTTNTADKSTQKTTTLTHALTIMPLTTSHNVTNVSTKVMTTATPARSITSGKTYYVVTTLGNSK